MPTCFWITYRGEFVPSDVWCEGFHAVIDNDLYLQFSINGRKVDLLPARE